MNPKVVKVKMNINSNMHFTLIQEHNSSSSFPANDRLDDFLNKFINRTYKKQATDQIKKVQTGNLYAYLVGEDCMLSSVTADF